MMTRLGPRARRAHNRHRRLARLGELAADEAHVGVAREGWTRWRRVQIRRPLGKGRIWQKAEGASDRHRHALGGGDGGHGRSDAGRARSDHDDLR
jgi:hypothetical protein